MIQRFTSFQTVMLQKMKDLAINMVPQLSNQQRSNLLSPPPNDIFHTQPPTYPYHGAFIQHPYPPQTIPHSPLAHMYLPSYPHTPPVHIPPQFSQGNTSSSNKMLPPPPKLSPITTNSTTQQSQTSFEHTITELYAEL